jgi:hypothetical protein
MTSKNPKYAYNASTGQYVMLDVVDPTETIVRKKQQKKSTKKQNTQGNPIPGSDEYHQLQTATVQQKISKSAEKRNRKKKKQSALLPLPSEWKWSGLGEIIPLIEYWITQNNSHRAEATALAYLTIIRSMVEAKGPDACYSDYDRLRSLLNKYETTHEESCKPIAALIDLHFPNF